MRALILLPLLLSCAPPAAVRGEDPPAVDPTPAPTPESGPQQAPATRWDGPLVLPPLSPVPSPIQSLCPADEDLPKTLFADVSDCAGIDVSHAVDADVADEWLTSGQAWADLNGDRVLDLVLTNQKGENVVLLGGLHGAFEAVPASGVEGYRSGGATLLDADGDGVIDLHLTNSDEDALLLGDGTGHFAPPPAGRAMQDPGLGNGTAWADYDGDGDLDAYTANYTCFNCSGLGQSVLEQARDTLWRNDGEGVFTEVGDDLGDPLLRAGPGCQPAWFDYDDDGDLDLYLANDKGFGGEPDPAGPMNRNVLFRNDGPGCGGHCWTEAAREAGLDARKDAMCLAIGDYDNDLDLDVFMTDTTMALLLQNQGGGSFVDVTLPAGLGVEFDGWGCVWLDYDNDGWLDLYAAGGLGYEDHLWRNAGDGSFVDQSDVSGASDAAHSMGVAAADYDEDGAVDLVVANLADRYRLLRNLGSERSQGDWLGLDLVGRGSGGRDAVGARAWVTTDDGLVQLREVKIGSSLGAGNTTRLHFGLGDRSLQSVRLRWPDGTEQDVAVPHNTWSRVEQPAP